MKVSQLPASLGIVKKIVVPFVWVFLGCLFLWGKVAEVRGQQPDSLPVDLGSASVTIPYSELLSLWEKAHSLEDNESREELRPPVEWTVDEARYLLDVSGGDERHLLQARYEVQNYSDEWKLIPLLGGDVRLAEQSREGSRIVWKDGQYCLLTNQAGGEEVSVRFSVRSIENWSLPNTGWAFTPGPATAGFLEIKGLPPGRAVYLGDESLEAFGNDSQGFELPADGGSFVVTAGEVKKFVPPIPSEWMMQSQLLVQFSEERLQYVVRSFVQADSGSGMGMEVILPPNASRVVLEGEDLAGWHTGPREEGGRSIRVDWRTRDVLDRTIRMSYEVPQSPLQAEWFLYAPRLKSEADESGDVAQAGNLFVVVADEGLELSGDGLFSAAQSRRLPRWMQDLVGTFDFLSAEAGVSFVLRAEWLPRLQTAEATIREAAFRTQLVRDGALLVHADYHVRHQGPLGWEVELPPSEQVLACQVNQKSVQPITRGESAIEFGLGAPRDDDTTIHFCYAARAEPLDAVSGRVLLTLPKTSLLIHELDWTLLIPEAYEITDIEGNVDVLQSMKGSTGMDQVGPASHTIRLTKQLCRDEQPFVELYYRKRGFSQ